MVAVGEGWGVQGWEEVEKVAVNDTPIIGKGGAVSLYAYRVGSGSHSVPVAVTLSASHGSGGLSVGRLSRPLRRVSRSPRLACRFPLAVRAVRLGLGSAVV